MKRLLRYGISWAVTLCFMAWALHGVPWREVWNHGMRVAPTPLLMACALSILGNAWFACEKYRLILRMLGAEVRLREVMLLKLGSIPMKNLLPMKSGEALRVIYLHRIQGLSYARGGVLVAVNLGLSVAALGLLMIPGYFALPGNGWVWMALGLGGLVATPCLWGLGRHGARPSGSREGPGKALLRRRLRALWALEPAATFRLLMFSLGFEAIKAVNYGLVFHALGIEASWSLVVRKAPILILASSVPISVMGLGIREGGVLVAFANAADEAHLLGAALWISVVEGVIPLLVGLTLLKPFLGRLLGEGGVPDEGSTAAATSSEYRAVPRRERRMPAA